MVVNSNILKNEELISYEDWCEHINSLKTDSLIKDEKTAVALLANKLNDAIKKRIPNEKFGILFSGGLDSTLIAYICKKFTDNFICYTVGLEKSKDIEWSQKIAEKLDLTNKIKILTLNEAEKIFEKTSKILGKELINIVNIGVGAVEVASIELTMKNNTKKFFSGLGSEEIFAGYQRHSHAKDINKECWSGLKTTWERDFQRDSRISKYFNIDFLTPFLDKELILAAMSIHGSLKIKNGYKKYILRKTAVALGMNREFAFRPKKAAQYGSNIDKALHKIAKLKGFKYKKEYLSFIS